jgi:hypothetical protein
MRAAAVLATVLLAISAVAGGVTAQQLPDAVATAVAERQRVLLDALRRAQLPESLADFGAGLRLDPLQLAGQKLLSPGQDASIQQVVEEGLKPVPIINGMLVEVLAQDLAAPFYTPLTSLQKAQVAAKSRSVGRLEIKLGDDYLVVGTAFVTSENRVATNCHVVKEFAALVDGDWELVGDVRVDFSDTQRHAETAEYRVTAITTVPPNRWLDVAVLTVAPTSVVGATALPAPLTAATAAAAPRTPVAVIGFPDVASARTGIFRDLRRRADGVGKVMSPGAIESATTHEGVEILLHAAGTLRGSSGSPVIATDTLHVVGVHNCCTGAAASPSATSMPCSDVWTLPASRNQAVSMSTIRRTAVLASQFMDVLTDR